MSGQGYELRIAMPDGSFRYAMAEAVLFAEFEHRHEAEYGRSFAGQPEGDRQCPRHRDWRDAEDQRRKAPPGGGTLEGALVGTRRPTVFRQLARIWKRWRPPFTGVIALPVDAGYLDGPPMILQQDSARRSCAPGDTFRLDGAGNILIRIAG